MPLREFDDRHGRHWQVWDTIPSTATTTSAKIRQSLLRGWLTFTAGKERRRLIPLPDAWDIADEQQLRHWLDQAEDAPPFRQIP